MRSPNPTSSIFKCFSASQSLFRWSYEPVVLARFITILIFISACCCTLWSMGGGIQSALSMQSADSIPSRVYWQKPAIVDPAFDEGSGAVSERFVLQLQPNLSASDLASAREQFNLSELSPFTYGDSDLWMATVDMSTNRHATVESSSIGAMMESDLIISAEPETFFTAYGFESVRSHAERYMSDAMVVIPNDTYYEQQWALDAIQLEDAWETTTGSSEIIVAVLDSGAEMDHPDLLGNLVAGYDFIDGDNEPWDDLGHGTHVASVIGGLTNNGEGTAGINWHIKVMPIKVLNERGVGSVQHIIEGIEWAVDHGADIINLSLGSPDTSIALRLAVRRAVDIEGIVVVAASGNEYEDGNPVSYPAAYREVIAVGATDEEGNHAPFSSSGNHLDVAAPGIEILAATWTGSGAEYAYYTGTSMSAPIVSGVVGLMLAVDGELSPERVSSILTSNAQDVGAAGWDEFTGYGIVNAGASMRDVSRGIASPTATPTATATDSPTNTPAPTNTLAPTATPPPLTPSATPVPTSTSQPTAPNVVQSDFTIFVPLLTH